METQCPNANESERTFHLYQGFNVCSVCLGMYILPNDLNVMYNQPEQTDNHVCRLPISYYSQEIGGMKDMRLLVIDTQTRKPVGVTGWNGSAHYGGAFMTNNDGTYVCRVVTRNMPVLVSFFPNGGFHSAGTSFRAGFGMIETEQPFGRAEPVQSLHILLLRPSNAAAFSYMGSMGFSPTENASRFDTLVTTGHDTAAPRRMRQAEFQPGREVVAPVRLMWGAEMGVPDPVGDLESLRTLIGTWWEEEHPEPDRERVLRLLQEFDTQIRTIIQ